MTGTHRHGESSEHVVTVFALADGGSSAWCHCGDRFDSSAARLVQAWAQAHGQEVHFYPATGHITAA